MNYNKMVPYSDRDPARCVSRAPMNYNRKFISVIL